MALPLIKVVQLTLTNRCQLNCGHCGVAELRSVMPGELTLEQIDDVFRDLRLAGCLVVDLFGASLRSGRTCSRSSGRGMARIHHVPGTNGWLLDGAFVRELEAAGLDQIYLSWTITAGRARPAEGGGGGFERAVRALELGGRVPSSFKFHRAAAAEFFTGGHMNGSVFVLEKEPGR
jgi:MoaA/NifB/PqqE/SkfB family radical SAM enzyme